MRGKSRTFTLQDAISEVARLEVQRAELLDALEGMARQHCYTGGSTTDSEAISSDAAALRLLARHGRFRIVNEGGRMVIGFWPGNDPEKGGKL